MYIYDRAVENANEYLSRPRQCLPIAYVIYNRKKPTPSLLVPVYHFHCSGVMQPTASETIDLTSDDESESASAVPLASVNRTGQPSSSSGSSSITWQSLERHFLSLTSDMISTQSQVWQNSVSAVASVATLTSPAMGHSGDISSSVNSCPVVFVFPVTYTSTGTSSTELPQVASITSISSQPMARQQVSGGSQSSSLPGTAYRSVAGRQSGGAVRSTTAVSLQNTPIISSPASVVGSITPQSVFPTAPSSITSQIRVVPSSVVLSSSTVGNRNTVLASSVRSVARFPPFVVNSIQRQCQISTDTSRVVGRGVQMQTGVQFSQQTPSMQNYRIFRLQPQQSPPRIITSFVQPQFNIPAVCTGYGVNLTSVHSAQPVPLVTTVSSLFRPLVPTVSSQYQLFMVPSSAYFSSLPQPQVHTPQQSPVQILPSQRLSETSVTWTAGLAGSRLVNANREYHSTLADEFVDMESISTDQMPPIVIAPDNTIDEYDLPADCAAQDVSVKSERVSPLQRSVARRRYEEVICIDDNETANSTDVGTQENLLCADGTSSGCNITDEPNMETRFPPSCFTDETSSDYSLLTGDIPPINIEPDNSSCSPVQTDYLQAADTSAHLPLPSSAVCYTNSTLSTTLFDGDTLNVGPVTASSNSVSTVTSSTYARRSLETDGSLLVSSANSTAIASPFPTQFSGLVFTPQITGEINSTNTVHHFPQSGINVSPLSVSVQADNVLEMFSTSVTSQPGLAAPLNPVLVTLMPPVPRVLTSVVPRPAPVNLAPLAPKTCDVTAMAAQLVSGLRSDAMRRRATSAAKVAVPQSTQSESATTRSQNRHAGKPHIASPSKSSRYVPPILNRSSQSAKKLAKSSSASPSKPDKKQGETVVYHVNDDGSIEIRIEKGSLSENTCQRRKQTPQRGGFDAIVEVGCSASQSLYSKTFVTDMEKYFDNLKVVNLYGNNTSVSGKSMHLPALNNADVEKQQLTDDGDKALESQNDDAASDSDTLDTLSIVLNSVEPSDEEDDPLVSGKSVHLPALNNAYVEKQQLTDDGDKALESQNDDAASDSDTLDTLSIVLNSVEPSDEEDDQPSALDMEGENSSGLKITNVCSIDAETFTDLSEQFAMTEFCAESDGEKSASASVGRTAEDVELSRRSCADVSDAVADIDLNVNVIGISGETEARCDKHVEDGHTDTSTILDGDSSWSADCNIEPLRNNSSFSENCEKHVDLEDEGVSPVDDSGSTSLFEISLDSEAVTDSEAALTSCILPDEDGEPADCSTGDETVQTGSNLTIETDLLPALDECGSSAVLHAKQDETASDVSETQNDNEGKKRPSTAEVSSNYGCNIERHDVHVMSCSARSSSDHATQPGSVTQSSHNVGLTADFCGGDNVQSQRVMKNGEKSTLPSHTGVKTTNKIRTSCNYPSRPHVENVGEDSCLSSACEDNQHSVNTDIECLEIAGTVEDQLDQLNDIVTGKKATSDVTVPETEKSASLTRRISYDNLIDTEPISPLPEPLGLDDVEPDDSSVTMARRLEIEPVSSLVPSAEKLETPATCYSDLLDTEPVSPLPEHPSESDCSSPMLLSPPAPAADKLSTKTGPSCSDMSDTEVQECVVEADKESVGLAADESLLSVTRCSYDNLTDTEPVSTVHIEQTCDVDRDVDIADSSPTVATDDKSHHVEVTEKSASPAGHTYSSLIDTHSVCPVREHTGSVVDHLHEPEHNSSFSLNLASPHAAVTEELSSGTERSVNKLCEIKSTSALSVFGKSLSNARPVSPMWLSDILSTPLAASEPCYQRTKLAVDKRREYATVEHSSGSVSISNDTKQLRESHQAGRKASLATKVPKRITLADYRNRKSASQVHSADNISQLVEPSQAVSAGDSCQTASNVSESRSVGGAAEVISEPRSCCFSAVTAGADSVVSVNNPTLEHAEYSRASDDTPVSCELQPPADPHSTVSDIGGTCPSVDLDTRSEEETKTSNDVDDSIEAVQVAVDCVDELPSETHIMEMATGTKHSGVLSAASGTNVEKFDSVDQDNVGLLNPLSLHVSEMAPNDSHDGQNTKSLLENVEPLCSSGSDAELSTDDDNTEAVEDLTATPSLSVTDADILNDVLLNFATASESELEETAKRKQLSKKKRKAARKPWKFTLIPADTGDLSVYETATSSGSGDVRTQHMRYHDHEFELRDLPVTVPLEPRDTHGHCLRLMGRNTDSVMGNQCFDNDSGIIADGSLSVVPVKNVGDLVPSAAKQGQLLSFCKETPLLTDSSNSAETKDAGALKPDESASTSAVNKQVEDVSYSTHIESVDPSDYSMTCSSSSAVSIEMESKPLRSEFDISDGQHITRTPQSLISNLSKISMNSHHLTSTTSQGELETSAISHSDQKPVATLDDSQVKIDAADTADRRKHNSEILHTAVNSKKPVQSCTESICYNEITVQYLPNSSEIVSKTDDHIKFSLEECTNQDTVVKKEESNENETRPRKGHLKAATMWQDSMRDWVNMDMSKNRDLVVPKFTLSNDYFVMRHHVVRLMNSVKKLAPQKRVSVRDAVSSSLRATENLLQEQLVYVDVATQLQNSEAKLLIEKQLRMNDLLRNVESQLHEMSRQLYQMSDAEAELSSYEKADWSTESSLHHNILLLTRHMLYKEMSSLRCYHNSRLVYRLPNELCLDVEHDRFVSVEGSVFFLEYSILSLAECRQLFALKVEIEETQSNLAQLDSDCPGGSESTDVARKLGWLHRERKQRLDCISIKSVDSLQTLQAFLSQQLHWYRYVVYIVHY